MRARFPWLLALIAACGGEDPTTPPVDAPCGGAMTDTYAPGLTKTSEGGTFEVTLLESSLAPPDRGDNTFTFQVDEVASGAVIAMDAVEVRPWMPQHGHGSTPAAFAPAASGEVGPINFFMPGLWELRVVVEPAAPAPSERAVFTFCVQG